MMGALGAGIAVASAASPVYNIVQLSYRQRVTPMGLQARMHATMRTINSATAPVGAALGGLLATGIGIRATLVSAPVLTIGGIGWFIAAELPASARTAQAGS